MNMVDGAVAPHFWAAVEDCLVHFHKWKPCEAAETVTTLWRRLPTAVDGDAAFANMIYHAEPWKIACNLANAELAITGHQQEYRNLLKRNGLSD